jgi:5-methylcytosine-specific restriction protein A
VCGNGRAVERHHRRPRGMGGSSRGTTNTAANGLHLCGVCHRLVELNRTLALLLGWLLPQAATEPAQHRVMYRGEWALLDDNGDAALIAA